MDDSRARHELDSCSHRWIPLCLFIIALESYLMITDPVRFGGLLLAFQVVVTLGALIWRGRLIRQLSTERGENHDDDGAALPLLSPRGLRGRACLPGMHCATSEEAARRDSEGDGQCSI